jgi:hypothetical protein
MHGIRPESLFERERDRMLEVFAIEARPTIRHNMLPENHLSYALGSSFRFVFR